MQLLVKNFLKVQEKSNWQFLTIASPAMAVSLVVDVLAVGTDVEEAVWLTLALAMLCLLI